ncbi:MAG: hypothetical protein ACFB5Z_14770 [Elainellaceae cyanobacterium]
MSLFPHRYDFLHAEHPTPGQRPAWRTEHRYPLSDRLIDQGYELFGIRFGAATGYSLLDIDSGSQYHPRHDPQGISRILDALEPLGLVSYIACTSSYSGGLHLYFPFEAVQPCQKLSHAMKGLLQQAGLTLASGQLELFPNPRPYSQSKTLFNGHRLPLQTGSYLLNADFQPIWTSRDRFVSQWHQCAAQNNVTAAGLRRALKQQRRQYVVSGKANKFLNDLNAEIEPGWTGRSQTNYLLGRIALRTYVFGHVLSGGPPPTDTALTEQIVAIACALPGFEDWCQHRHEIEQRAEEWARCVENSKYYPYGFSKPLEAPAKQRDWNQEQFSKTAEKIKAAVEDLAQRGLPTAATARFKALLTYGIGGGSLYRHKELWHPDCLEAIGSQLNRQSDETLIGGEEKLDLSQEQPERALAPATATNSCTSLFPPSGGNLAPQQDCDPLSQRQRPGNPCLGCAVVLGPLLRRQWLKLWAQLSDKECFLRQWRSRQRVSTG